MKDKKRLEVTLSVRGDGSLSRNNLRSSNRSNRSNSSNNSSGLPVSEIFATDRFSAPYNRSFDILDKYRRQPNQYGYPAQSLQALHHYDPPSNNGYGIRERNNPYIDYIESPKPYYYHPQQLHNVGQYQPVYKDQSIRLHGYGSLPRSVSRQDRERDHRGNTEESQRLHRTLPRSLSRQDQQRDDPIFNNESIRLHGTLPRSVSRQDQQRDNSIHSDPLVRLHGTLPRSGSRHDQQKEEPIYPNSHYTLPAKYGPRRVRISELEPIVHGYGTYNQTLGCQFYLSKDIFYLLLPNFLVNVVAK